MVDIRKLIEQTGDNLPALLRKMRGQTPEILEGEVVGRGFLPAVRRGLPDIDGQLVSSSVDDLPIIPPRRSFMDNLTDLSPQQKAIAGAGVLTAASAPLFMNQSEQQSAQTLANLNAGEPIVEEEIPYEQEDGLDDIELGQSLNKENEFHEAEGAIADTQDVVQTQQSVPDRFEEQLATAQENDRSRNLMMGLLKAAQTGGAALAGSKADTSYADSELKDKSQSEDTFKSTLALKDANIKRLADAEDNNPNSQASKNLQETLRKAFPTMKVEGLTVAEFRKTHPALLQVINTQDAIASRKFIAAEAADAKAIKTTEDRENKLNINMGRHIDTYTGRLQKNYESLQKAEGNAASAKGVIDRANLDNDYSPGVDDLKIVYDVIRGLDDKSSVKEGEVRLTKEAMSLKGRIIAGANRITGGDMVDPATRKALIELIIAAEKKQRMHFNNQKNDAIAAGVVKGFDAQSLDDGIYPSIRTTESTTIPSGGKVKVVTSDGRTGMISHADLLKAPPGRFKEVK